MHLVHLEWWEIRGYNRDRSDCERSYSRAIPFRLVYVKITISKLDRCSSKHERKESSMKRSGYRGANSANVYRLQIIWDYAYKWGWVNGRKLLNLYYLPTLISFLFLTLIRRFSHYPRVIVSTTVQLHMLYSETPTAISPSSCLLRTAQIVYKCVW